ncbi:pole-4 [Pristionchus pacificus]|uniref:CBFD_NFYB_HMF domain-containing protein n=1 Tax=Pristionchus pacificus TaxID=54126 RepID=A0A454Y0G0_PRIPA|nr:pole-4 [Pristionchus pacificus]|eukprot:PDM61947.1 hypothetical protein PRIPAC_51389 [Pristionchus pacificus]
MSSQDDSQETANQFDDLVQTRLPLSKVKKIAKIDPNVHMINAEAVKLMAKGTESFICLLAKAAFTQAVLDKRKTIQTKDINTVIKQSPVFQLLQGALDDWPEFEKVERPKSAAEKGEGEDTVREGEDTAEETEETVEETEEATEETEEDIEDDTGLDNETEEEEIAEGDGDKENEFIAESGDSDMADTSPINESATLPDTVPLEEDSSMDHE